MMPKLEERASQFDVTTIRDRGILRRGGLHTWIARLAVGTEVVARHRRDQIVQQLLVARLLPLAEEGRHRRLRQAGSPP